MSDITMWEIENSLYSETVQLICGVDEAGRGPLAVDLWPGLCVRLR